MTVVIFLLDTSPSMLRPFRLQPVPDTANTANTTNTTNTTNATDSPPIATTTTFKDDTSTVSTTTATMVSRPHGFTLMDASKYAMEMLVKLFLNHYAGVKLALFTTAHSLEHSMQCGFRESVQEVLEAVKRQQVQTDALHGDLGQSLTWIFEYIHLYRMSHSLDNIGGGVYPMLCEPTYILTLTDGGPMLRVHTQANNPSRLETVQLQRVLNLPGLKVPGCEFHREPFRVDQRLVSLTFLPMKESKVREELDCSGYWLDRMVEAMNGKSTRISSLQTMRGALQDLFLPISAVPPPAIPSSLVEAGITIRIKITNASTPPAMVLLLSPDVSANNGSFESTPWGHWPIPEAFWLERNEPQIPFRMSAFTEILCTQVTKDKDWTMRIPPGFPFKKFALDPGNPLVKKVASQRGIYWCSVSMADPYRRLRESQPFGILKYNSKQTGANLWLLPYNFPALFGLVEESLAGKSDLEWHHRLKTYITSIPDYYRVPLRHAFSLLKGAHKMQVPSHLDTTHFFPSNPAAREHLKLATLHAKMEWERQLDIPKKFASVEEEELEDVSLVPRQELPRLWVDIKKRLYPKHDFGPRDERQQQMDKVHSVPVAKMGDFKEQLRDQKPLRFVFEEDEIRDRMLAFGNPYKRISMTEMVNVSEESLETTINVRPKHERKIHSIPSTLASVRPCTELPYVEAILRLSFQEWSNATDIWQQTLELPKQKKVVAKAESSVKGADRPKRAVADKEKTSVVSSSAVATSSASTTSTATAAANTRLAKKPRLKAKIDSATMKRLTSLIRKSGKSATTDLMQALQQVEWRDTETRQLVLQELISEAGRYKRQAMIVELQKELNNA